MTSGLTDFGVMTGLALIFLVLSWSYMRSLNLGRPLRPIQKKMLFYSFIFALGMCYLMLLAGDMHWPKSLLFPVIGIWGGVVGFVAWWRYRQSQSQTAPEVPRRPVSTVLAEVIPALGLLICVIAGAVEWEYIFEGQGRWWVGVLWLAGVAVCILAAPAESPNHGHHGLAGCGCPAHHRSHYPAKASGAGCCRGFGSSPSLAGEVLAQQPEQQGSNLGKSRRAWLAAWEHDPAQF